MICRFSALNSCAALIAALALAWPLAAPAWAQERPAQADKSEALDALKARDQELQAARDAQRKSAETEAALKQEIEQFGTDSRKLNQDLIDTAARLRGVEGKIAATEARLKPLDDNELTIRK